MTRISIIHASTIDSLCKDTSAGCLSCSAGTMKEVSVSYAIVFESILENLCSVMLSNDRIPISGTIFCIE
jgi:hypothetical protein